MPMYDLKFEDTEFIRQWEGHALKAYKCPAGVWTISYGITGPNVKPNMVITEEESHEMFMEKIHEFQGYLEKYLEKTPTINQYLAMLSLIWNIGPGNFEKSEVRKYFNEGNLNKAMRAFMNHTKAKGKILKGLVNRRLAEVNVFMQAHTMTF